MPHNSSSRWYRENNSIIINEKCCQSIQNATGGVDTETIFKINIKGHSKERPRFYKGKIFNPKGNWVFESTLAKAYQEQNLPNYQDEILKITIEFKFKIPKSYSKTRRTQALNGEILPRQDVDNLTKSVLDALNGTAYTDDKNIKEIRAWKRYAEDDEIIIMIEEL